MLDVAAWFIWLDAAGSSTLVDAPSGQPEDATSGKRIQVRYTDGWGILSLGHDDSFRSICEVFQVDLTSYPHLMTALERDQHVADYETVIARIRASAATLTRSEAGERLGPPLDPSSERCSTWTNCLPTNSFWRGSSSSSRRTPLPAVSSSRSCRSSSPQLLHHRPGRARTSTSTADEIRAEVRRPAKSKRVILT